MTYWTAQAIGIFGLIITFAIFQRSQRKEMLRFKMYAAVLYCIHFFLLGATTGAAMELIGGIRSYVFSKKNEAKWAQTKFWLFLFIALFMISGFFAWEGPHSILPIIGMIAGTCAFWLTNPKHIRLVSLIAPPLWLVYSIIVGSIPSIAFEVLMMSTVVIGIIRFDILGKTYIEQEAQIN